MPYDTDPQGIADPSATAAALTVISAQSDRISRLDSRLYSKGMRRGSYASPGGDYTLIPFGTMGNELSRWPVA